MFYSCPEADTLFLWGNAHAPIKSRSMLGVGLGDLECKVWLPYFDFFGIMEILCSVKNCSIFSIDKSDI